MNDKVESSRTAQPRIVVGVDGSHDSRAALAWALREAARRSCEVRLVHAWRPLYRNPADRSGFAQAAMTSHEHGEALLASAVGYARASAPAVTSTRQLVEGRPSAVLLDAAAGADLMVIGGRGLGGFHGLRLGSVALHIVSNAPCQVVVVRARERTRGPVLAGIDGSENSRDVLLAALREASLRRCALTVTWALYVHSGAEGAPHYDEALAAAEAEANPTLRRLLASTSQRYPEVHVETTFPIGYPAELLVNASATARLLVIGSHGGGGFTGMRIGSIAHAVVQHAHCGVMLVRNGVSANDERLAGQAASAAGTDGPIALDPPETSVLRLPVSARR